jgi:hypothetical protein
MPRDVLTLDVEINPTQIVQQTDLAREMIAQNLSVGGSNFGVGGPVMGSNGPIMGGPYGGMSPYVPAFAPESMAYSAFQAAFPGMYAPPGITPDMYSAGLFSTMENRAGQFVAETAGGFAQFGAELAGGGAGALTGASLGYKLFGAPGAVIGGAGGFALGGSVAGELAEQVITPFTESAEQFRSVANVFEQFGYKAGMGSFLQRRGDYEGAQSGKEIAESLARGTIDFIRDDVEVQSLGLNAQEEARRFLSKGFQNNIFGFQPEEFGGKDDGALQELFLENAKTEFRRTQDLAKAFNTTYGEAEDIRGDLQRLGANDDADIEGQIGLLGSARREFGLDPMKLFRSATVMGSGIARSYGLSGAFGMQQAEVDTFRLAEAERAGFLDRETKEAGGGLPNIAARFNALEDQQLGKGGYLRDLIAASTTPEGGLDSAKLKDFIGRGLTPLEAREEAVSAAFAGGDALKFQEEFNYNFRDLADQARREVPGFEQAGLSQEIMSAAKMMAAASGRQVTPATISAAAQRFGLDENSARAFVAAQGNFPKSADVLGLMEGTRAQFEDAEKDREDDPFAKLYRESPLAKGRREIQRQGENIVMSTTSGIEALTQRYKRAIGKKEDGTDATDEEKDEALKEFQAGIPEVAKNMAQSIQTAATKTGIKATGGVEGTLESLGAGVVDSLRNLVARVGDILSVIQGGTAPIANPGMNTPTSASKGETGDPGTGNK